MQNTIIKLLEQWQKKRQRDKSLYRRGKEENFMQEEVENRTVRFPFHTMVVQNLFFAISEKDRGLVQKLDYMSRRTTREKLLS